MRVRILLTTSENSHMTDLFSVLSPWWALLFESCDSSLICRHEWRIVGLKTTPVIQTFVKQAGHPLVPAINGHPSSHPSSNWPSPPFKEKKGLWATGQEMGGSGVMTLESPWWSALTLSGAHYRTHLAELRPETSLTPGVIYQRKLLWSGGDETGSPTECKSDNHALPLDERKGR